ncbi:MULTISPECIES: stage V sporulation protein D [unclassified Clostridium]|mgnify:FL=1|uniref:stage V sporulation protein D n=1 Tax=Clostridium TaxID=1485 RepID=UPI0018AB0659|nr:MULTISPECIES: stage V sporulation protein D [unclassified Clostridium]MBX9138407.1 stage V sporulation protein D [Clostridium sp. K12(2020)]MBX9145100.1 stage V sporulation protein D [Clostridium sp. K13]MDU2290397.1 stage V sporulation protein D [Clostridium celatum]
MTYKKKKYKKKKKTVGYKSRLFIVSVLVFSLLAFLILRLAWLTLVSGRELEAKANSEWQKEISVTATRGDILDRNGSVLVSSANVYRIDFDLDSVRNHIKEKKITMNDIAVEISNVTGVEVEEVLKALNKKNSDGSDASYSPLVRGVTKAVADSADDLGIYGLIVSRDVKRYYPNENFLASALGGINSEGTGLTGIELQYDDYLAGIAGMKIGAYDSWGNRLPFDTYKFTPPIDGSDIISTVDENLQYIAEKVAQKGLEEHNAKGVHVLIMDPNNGEILAMVNKPDYDPNDPYSGYEIFDGETDNDKIQNMWRNWLVSDTFEPGSTFKTVTMVAALEEGLVSDNETFTCNGGVKFGNTTVHCWKRDGHGTQTLGEVLKNSCNVGMMEIGERLGIDKLNEYIYKLGFGKTTGIDLPGEASGIVKSSDTVSAIDLATISFGQTNTVTTLQLMAAFNAIANGGDLIQPHIVKEISHEDESGNRVIDETIKPTTKKDVLSDSSTALLRSYLERTVTKDGPDGSFVQGYNVGGKTGTAQKVDPATGTYSTDKYISSMVALAPVENPQITVFIAVDEPSNGSYYGGEVAAPLMKELFEEVFKYMDSPLAKERFSIYKNVIIPDVRGKSIEEAKEILKENDLEAEVKGNGKTIVSMDSYPGSTVKEGTTISITAKDNGQVGKEIIMPDLKGSTKEFAASILDNLGLEYEFEGEGIVYSQSITSGNKIVKGTKVTITLKKEFEY